MLQKFTLGQTGLEVTEFCLGVLPVGPLQANLSVDESVTIIKTALNYGVNFLDTAEMYGTQSYLGKALEGRRSEVVIATKSASATYDEMAKSVEKSLKELKTDYIDIYHLHAARDTAEVFSKRAGALKYLHKMKDEGIIKAVGISTHNVTIVDAAAERADIDIVFPLINKTGLGINGGTKEDMITAIGKASAHGKGLYAMKALGGGNLIEEIDDAINWVRDIQGISSVAVGVVSERELAYDLNIFGLDIQVSRVLLKRKKLMISPFCKGCETCIEACPNGALSMLEGKAQVNREKCLLCGYCSPKCPEFAIRLI